MIPVQEEKVQKTPTSLRRLFTIYSKGKISSPLRITRNKKKTIPEACG